ncbi:MAG TPA: glycosyltransferase family 4 protein [Opitutaceae bacterium]|jgi:glycosyltransferase involved in cell wall biosynthesis
MNILFIEQQPRFIGGSERITLSLCTQMRRHGHGTHLVYETVGDMVSAFAEVTDSCTRARVLPIALRRPLEAAASLGNLRRIVRRHRIDVLFTSHLGYVPLLAAQRFLGGKPSLVHIGLGVSLRTTLFRWAMPRIDAIVAPSEPMRQICADSGWPVGHLQVIPNGVDLERFKPAADRGALRSELGLPPSLSLAVYAGRLVAEKGVFTLVRAAARLRRSGLRFHLAIVGAAPASEAGELASLATSEGLGPDDFTLRGPTDRPERYFAAADITVVPTQGPESFGLVAIEAMACASAPIVSDAGILPEIVGRENGACWFRQGDEEELSQKLLFLFTSHGAREAVVQASLERVRARYSLVECSKSYERALSASIAGK